MKKKTIVVTLITMMVLSTAVSMAASNSEQVLMSKSSAKIYVDCGKVQLSQEPFIYNGTTYLPVRAVSDALGEKITYETSTNAIYIGTQPGEALYMTEVLSPVHDLYGDILRLDYVNKLGMLGKTYNTAFEIKSGGNMEFELNGKYETLTADLGIYSGAGKDATIPVEIYRDSDLYDTYYLDGTDSSPVVIKIPLKGVNKLKIQLDDWTYGNANVALGNPMITKSVTQ